ncbi:MULTISPECIES: helix-turn-helix transcriptional regulator [unclassified Methylococcus]|uniref:helix-turn-helix transcriptional regulator n=1 Tax=unclassified Methylococcus TaxID=2618889 RepID=UPI003D7E1B39
MDKTDFGSLPDDALLTPTENAKWLRTTKATLNYWRVTGGGPPWLKIGRNVRYRAGDVRSWLVRCRHD